MRIGIVGGTGKQGTGLARRWIRAGRIVAIGSRDPAKAQAQAEGLGAYGGGDYTWCARNADVVVLSVPYAAHGETLRAIAAVIEGKVLLDMTVPLAPPKVSRVHIPPGQAAALEAQAIVGSATPVVAALHHVSAAHLADPQHPIECDVLVASDDARAKSTALQLVADLGLRGLDAGPLANAVALESLTPVLIHLNRTYKSTGAGVVFTNLNLAQVPRGRQA
jgi:8-hydroxy-5-deazaflavin:NADPH oxidoreductase